MPTIADYSILLDHTLETGRDEPWTFNFTLPDSADLSTRSILDCMVKVLIKHGPMFLIVHLNGKKVAQWTLGDGWYGPLHKVIPNHSLRHGENTLRFDTDCEGPCVINAMLNDVTLLWQNKI